MKQVDTPYIFQKQKVFWALILSFLVSFPLQAADFYWVGGAGNWSDFATHWATTSGGATFHTNAPTAADNVFFDVNSGVPLFTVSLDVAAQMNDFSWDVSDGTITGNTSFTVNGISTINATRILNFGVALSTGSYTFIGDLTAGTTTTINFRTSGALSFANVTVGQGSTFRFAEPPSTTIVSGVFTPNGTCTNPITLSSTGATANVNFTNPQTWGGVNVSQINSTGANVTVNSISVVVSGNFTDGTGNRALYWVGNGGNWSDPVHWSATSGGAGGECPPTTNDDVFFDANSFSLATQTVTLDVDGGARDMDWTGVTNTPTFTGIAARTLTITGSLTLDAGVNQTGLAPTYQGLVSFSTGAAQIITMNGKGLNNVQFLQTSGTASWTLQDAFLVQNEILLLSGEFNTNNENVTAGSINAGDLSNFLRTLTLGSSAITLNGTGTVLNVVGDDANLTLNSGTSTATITNTGAVNIETGTATKTLPNLVYSGVGAVRTINTGSDVNTITFQDITVAANNGSFDIIGTSPKIYEDITIANNVTGTLEGTTANTGNNLINITIGNNSNITLNGGYYIDNDLTTGTNSTFTFGTTAGNVQIDGNVNIGTNANFEAQGAKGYLFNADFTLLANATATFSNTPAISTNVFTNNLNLNSGTTVAFSSVATSSIAGTINVLGSCNVPITLTSNNPPTQAQVNLVSPLDLFGATVQNINATGAAINVSNGVTANNTNVTGTTISRDLYWVHSVAGAGSTATWYDAANWSLSSGGATGECPPTIYDNVFFDTNSFSAAGQIVDMDADAFCRNMNWTGVTNSPFLQSIGEDTDLTVGGNVTFVAGMTVGTGGANPNEIRDIYFAATNAIPTATATTNNTIDWGIGANENTNGKRFQRAFFNQNKEMVVATTATWTLASAFNLTQEAPLGRLTLQNGEINTSSFNMQLRILDANGATGSLNIGSSEITLRATGLTFDFRNDANFTFVTPAANAQFILTSNGGNVDGYTGSEQKELPDIIVTQNNNVTINTENATNRLTFRNIDLQDINVVFNLTGTSPKTYSEPLTFNTGVNATFNGGTTNAERNVFTGAITFATNSRANFVGRNDFDDTFTVGGTTGTGIRFTGTGRNIFDGDVFIGANSLFSLQNTSSPPNRMDNVTLSDGVVFEFSTLADNVVTANFIAIANCLTPIRIQSSVAGNQANVDFGINQSWENVIVRDINNTGTGTVSVLSGTDGGNNTNIDFSPITARVLYWVHSTTGAFAPANWNDPANWSLTSGGVTGECPPTLSDDVFFDVNSFNDVNQLVLINANAETRDMTWTGATGNPILTGATTFTLQMGGSVTLINAMNLTFAGESIFRNTKTGTNTITSAGQDFDGDVTFWDNTVGTGTWQLADAFATLQTFNLVDGTFTTTATNFGLTARIIDVFSIANTIIPEPTRELNLNSSTTDVTLNNGLAVDFRGNTTNFVLSSTATSQLRLLGNGDLDMQMGSAAKTIPNIQIVNTGAGNVVNIESSNVENNANRITFRDITAFQDGLIFNINGQAPKTYNIITFPNNAEANFNGVDNVAGLRNEFNGAIIFGQDSNIDWYDDNTFDAPITIESTINSADAVRHYEDNLFTTNAPVTFSAVGRARWRVGGSGTINVFQAPVNMLGTPNRMEFLGNASTIARFESTLFVQSSVGQQSYVEFDCRPDFRDNVEFGDAAGGNSTAPLIFRLGVDFASAPVGTTLTTGIDSRLIFDAGDVSVIRDMNVGENNVLTFNNDLTIDNMNLTRFDVVNFPNSDGTATDNGVTTITGFLNARSTSCDQWISIRSNLVTVRAEIDFQNPHLVATNTNLNFTFIQDIENISANTIEASPDPIVNVANNVGITFIGSTVGTTYYWVVSPAGNYSGDWNGLGVDNHWALSSNGPATGCIPTPNDNVIFDDNSFAGGGVETVNIDNFFSYCKDMTWSASNTNRGRLIGDNLHTVQVFGDLYFADFVSDRDWNDFPGTFEFKGTSTPESKTLQFNGSRFFGNVIFNSPVDDWTLIDSMRVEGGTNANITINYGILNSGDQNIRLERNWTVNLPTGGLPQATFVAGTNTVTFDGNIDSDISIYDVNTGAACTECSSVGSSCSGSPFYNLTNEKGFNTGLARFTRTEINTTISILNNFHIMGGYFEDDGFQIRGNATGTVYMANNTLLRLGDNNDATVFPTCYLPANIILANGTPDGLVDDNSFPVNGSEQASIVEYRCPDEQMVAGGIGFTYATLRLISNNTANGNNIKRFTGEAIIDGALFIGDEQTVYDMGYQLQGNSHNQTGNALLTGTNATLVFGTNQNVTERTYTSTNVPLNVTVPTPVAADIATTFPKFTVGDGTLGNGVLASGTVPAGKVNLSTTSTVIYNANTAQEVAGGIAYNNIILRSTGAVTSVDKTITRHNLVSNGEITINGNALVESLNHFIDDGFQITGNGTGTFTGQADSKLILGNQTIGTNFPSLFTRANISLDADNHETIYNADVAQTMSTEPQYGNLTLTTPNSTLATLIEKRFSRVGTPSNDPNAIIRGHLLINERNHLLDDGNQITGLVAKSVTMNSDVPNQGRSWLTLGTNGATDRNTQFPLNFGTVVLNDSTTVIYNCGSSLAQNVRGFNGSATGTDSYYNLIAQSGGEFTARKVLQNPTRVRNNFTIRTGTRFEDNQQQITGSTSTAAGVLQMESGATLYVGLNNTGTKTVFPTNYERARIILANTSTVRYQSRRTAAPVQVVSSEPIYGNLYLDAGYTTSGANITKQIAATPVSATNTTLTVTRDLTINYRVRFEDLGIQIIGNATNNLLVQDGSELVLGTATQATLFPTDYVRANTDMSAADVVKSTVIYNSGIAGNDISAEPIYGNVILRNPTASMVTKNLLGNTDIWGNLTIENQNTLEVTASNFNINLRGNWTCQPNGVFTSQQGKVTLEGSSQQVLTTNTQRFYNLEANNTGAGFLMMDNVYIKSGGRVGFIDGVFRMNGAPALPAVSAIEMIFENGANVDNTVGSPYPTNPWINNGANFISADGPSNASHVVGRVRKIGSDDFIFPIGNGINYAPAGVSAPANATDEFSAYYVGPRFPTTDGYDVTQKEPTIIGVSHLEYWIINRDAGSSPVYVYLSWDNPRSQAYVPSGLRVLRWNGSLWTDNFNGGYSNAAAKGLIASSAPITTFSPFTLGTNITNNILPVEFLSFDAQVEGESVKVTWKTTNEMDNSHFMVQRSQNGTNFTNLAKVNAKGNGLEGVFDYQFWDEEPFEGRSYYRLNQFDLGGSNKFSPVVSVLFEKGTSGVEGTMVLYPNPNEGARFYLNLNGRLNFDAKIEILDMAGRQVHSQMAQQGEEQVVITPLRTLSSGTYILKFVTPKETVTKLFVVE